MASRRTQRRKRQRARRNNQPQPLDSKKMTPPPSSMSTVQRQRASGAAGPVPKRRNGPNVSDYMHCRLSPFTHTGGSYLPDGSSVKRVTKEIRMFYDITIGSSGGFLMMAIPEIPRGVVFKDLVASPATGVIVSGVTCSGINQGPNSAGSWFGPVFPDWATWASLSPTAEVSTNPWFAAKGRIITQAFRMMYTGQSLSCAGTITVSENELGVSPGSAPNIATVTQYTPASGADAVTWASGTILHNPVVVTSSSNSLNSTSRVMTVAEGAYFTLSRNTLATPWVDMQDLTVFVEGKLVAMMAFQPGLTNATTALWDHSFTPKLAVVSGMTAGTTIRVEQMMCVEFEPTMGSAFREFARVPPPAPPAQIKQTEAALAKMPVAGPLSWTDRIIDVALGAVKVGKAVASVL